jgi:hypothetical protein
MPRIVGWALAIGGFRLRGELGERFFARRFRIDAGRGAAELRFPSSGDGFDRALAVFLDGRALRREMRFGFRTKAIQQTSSGTMMCCWRCGICSISSSMMVLRISSLSATFNRSPHRRLISLTIASDASISRAFKRSRMTYVFTSVSIADFPSVFRLGLDERDQVFAKDHASAPDAVTDERAGLQRGADSATR